MTLRSASLTALLAVALPLTSGCGTLGRTTVLLPELHVQRTEDFQVDGSGAAPAWVRAEWVPLRKRDVQGRPWPDGLPYDARFKILYSPTGLYVLMEGTDARLTATLREDFLFLWEEDVFEVFLWPDESTPIYFEYELSPLGYELPILVPNLRGVVSPWRPWHYVGEKKVRKATSILGGSKESGAEIRGWRAEIFIPFAILAALPNVPPVPGTRWRGNFYRIDYDDGKATQWDWAPVGKSFHEFEGFGILRFE